jgi:Arm DNA-binding domain/Phage integrase, N-terminal SAM-like domain
MQDSINETAKEKTGIKITKRSVENLEPLPSGALVRYDDKLAGFGVRVMTSGRRFYFARYRNKHGRSRWFTIGEHGKVTAEAARKKAQGILQTVAVDGRDPSGEREAFRAAPTVNDLLDRYVKEHLEQRNRPRTIDSFKGIVERDIRPEIGHLKVAAVTRQDMHKLHAARSKTPRQANMIVSVCSKVFNLAEFGKCARRAVIPAGRSNVTGRTIASAFYLAKSLRSLAPRCAGLRVAAFCARTAFRRFTGASPRRRSSFCCSPDAGFRKS